MSCSQNAISLQKKGSTDFTLTPVTTQQPEEKKIYPIVIIGAGAAGTMAVKRAILNNDKVLLFTGAQQEQRRSRGNWVRTVDNIPGLTRYKRPIVELRNEVLEELSKSPWKNNLHVVEDSIYSIEQGKDFFTLIDGAGHTYYGRYVILATGIMDEQPLIQGSIRPVLKFANGQTIAYCALCDGHRSFGKKTVVIGYSENAADMALLLAETYHLTHTAILTHGKQHEFSPYFLQQLQSKKIPVYNASIQEVLGNKELKQLTGFLLETGEIIEAEMGFVALGIRPNNSLALQLGAQMDENGLVITNSHGESSILRLYVVGDLRANSLKQIYTAWQHAVDSVLYISECLRRDNMSD
jgi:thioredoxin reductase (NADPH)